MNRYLFKAGAVAGVASFAMLAAGPAMAAGTISQAKAEGLNLSIVGNKLISGSTVATNDGTQDGHGVTDNTIPPVAGAVPGSNAAGLGVVLQDAWADKQGNSAACAGLAGQGSGLVSVGSKPCAVKGSQAATVDLATLDLGKLIASPDSIVGQVLQALGINGNLLPSLQDALVTPITSALSSTLGNVGLTGSLGAVAGMCSATPDSATGTATIADSHLDLNLAGTTFKLVDFPANPAPNTHLLTDLDKVTQVVLDAVTTQVTNLLNSPASNADPTLLGALGSALAGLGLGGVTGTLGHVLGQITGAVQSAIITPLVNALEPLLKPLQDNVLDVTLNEQPVPQKAKTFETTALDLQVLPLLKPALGGSLIGGTIGHVLCGPNARPAVLPSESPNPSPTATPTTPNNVPTNVDSGVAGDSSHSNAILAAVAALLAMTGVAGAAAYRRYGMPRG